MVGVFVRLKLRMLRNSMRGRQVGGMVLGGLVGLAAAAVTIVLGATQFDNPESSVDVLAAVYGAWLVGWILAPVATGGGDETLRPEHFSLLPIGRRQLATGLLAASLVAVTSVVSLIAFASLVVYGARLGAGPALLGVLFAVLLLMLVVLVYRVLMAALGALLTSRKGKELGIVLVALTALSGVGVNYVLYSLGPALISGNAAGFAGVMRVLPSGWGPVAVRAAADGSWGFALLLLAATALLVVGLVAVWGVLLARRNTVSSFRGTARVRAEAGAMRRSLLPVTPVGAVAGKELRTWWRDARRRIALLSSLVVGLVLVIAPSFSGGSAAAAVTLPYIGVFVVAFSCLQAGNLYGFDGSALWHTVVTPDAYGADVRGRQLAWALIVGPVALLLAIVLPGVAGQPAAYPWVLGLVPALLGAGAGMLVLQSVYVAYAMPDPRNNASPFSSGGRPGCTRMLLMLALMVLLVLGALPVVAIVVAGVVADLSVLRWLGVPVGVLTGAVLAWWWGRLAWRRLADRAPELLATVSNEA